MRALFTCPPQRCYGGFVTTYVCSPQRPRSLRALPSPDLCAVAAESAAAKAEMKNDARTNFKLR